MKIKQFIILFSIPLILFLTGGVLYKFRQIMEGVDAFSKNEIEYTIQHEVLSPNGENKIIYYTFLGGHATSSGGTCILIANKDYSINFREEQCNEEVCQIFFAKYPRPNSTVEWQTATNIYITIKSPVSDDYIWNMLNSYKGINIYYEFKNWSIEEVGVKSKVNGVRR